MEEPSFDLKAARLALAPPMCRMELARKMGVGYSFLTSVERGHRKLSSKRREQFAQIAAEWAMNPVGKPRKPRKDIGKSHRSFKLTKPRKPRVWVPKAKVAEPIPVPHTHHEIVGIGR